MKVTMNSDLRSTKERTLFPSRVPPEVQTLVTATKTMDKLLFRKLIKHGLAYIDGSYGPEECEITFNNICSSLQCSNEEEIMDISIQYSGVVTLLKASFRLNNGTTKQESFAADLAEIGFAEEFTADICKVVYGSARPDINKKLLKNSPHLPIAEELQWRVDVTISSSWLSRVLEPSVNMKIKMEDGTDRTFEIPLTKFHELRYTTADILQQMEAINLSSAKKESK